MGLREKQGDIEENPSTSELHKILSREKMAPVGDSIPDPWIFSCIIFFGLVCMSRLFWL